MAEEKYNLKNTAVKRILQEVKEMQSNPSDDFMSLPLEPNGRFETQTKICLSISNHHPEHWQPSWSVRTALVALIAFMPTSPNGALGSLEYTKEERVALAVKSRNVAPKFGNPERQKLIDEIHEYMISKTPHVPQHSPSQSSEEHPTEREGEAKVHQQESIPVDAGVKHPNQEASDRFVEEQPVDAGIEQPNQDVGDGVVEEQPVDPGNAHSYPAYTRLVREIPAGGPRNQPLQRPEMRGQQSAVDDRLFTWAAIGLTIAIMVLLFKKFIKSSGHGAVFMDGS
ncbi:ubiquitin-conjugating enzyme E2 32-like isoform X2 [Hibiscus syriacus]|uniref:ubiquitin-conjugating enzyme E2 32-like isoform X2 n=1 Tax=Hibiscus syriacus TaxID=106335 RepID=UPI001921BBBC|nr:ubiquitin-conjugating enzyme E2 32-like isoform X2 [Hibiscus syriacus]